MIELDGLTKRFDDFTAVDGVTFSVSQGEILALLGPNGAGKTTTVRMLAAILRPTEGDARVARVFYAGLASHPQSALARQQMRGQSGMFSFELADNGREQAFKVVDALKEKMRSG